MKGESWGKSVQAKGTACAKALRQQQPGGVGAKAQRTVGLEPRKSTVREEAERLQGQVMLGLAAPSEMGAIQCVAGSLSRLRGRDTSWTSGEVGAGVIQARDGAGSGQGARGEGEKWLDSEDVF